MVAQWFHRWAEAEALMDCPQIEAHPAQLCFLLLEIMATDVMVYNTSNNCNPIDNHGFTCYTVSNKMPHCVEW
jgi:hypothetical protein